jgi:hypothetical protein
MVRTGDYSNGKIYKIVSYQTDKIYIGSTCQKYLSSRLQTHRYNFKSWKDGKFTYISAFEIMCYDDAEIILLENYPCETKYELEARERYYIVNEANAVNKNIPTRNDKDYYEDKKATILENCRKWRERNKEKIKEYFLSNKEKLSEKKKEYRLKNKDKIAEYAERNKEKWSAYRKKYTEKHKEEILVKAKTYRDNHKDEISEYMKDYRDNHKDEISEYMKDYRLKNRDKIEERRKMLGCCPNCQKEMLKESILRHIRKYCPLSFENTK